MVAATFLAALESASRYDPGKGEVRAWLLGVAHNQLGLLRRRESAQRGIAGAIGGRGDLSEDAFARLVEQISAAQESAVVQHALEQLPEHQREALLLVSSDELTPKAAAAVLGISATAFRVRLFRARRTMQALLPSLADSCYGQTAVPKEVRK